MPTVLHQAALLPFEDDSKLGFDLAREVFEVPLPVSMQASDRHAALSLGLPAAEQLGEVIPDLVLCGSHPAHPQANTSLIIEAQRLREKEKLIKFLVYLALTAHRFQQPAWLLVLALGRDVTTWLRNLAREYGGLSFQPLVLDRSTMPRVISEQAAIERPAQALLSALIHAPWGDMEVVEAALCAARRLDEAARKTYTRGILSAVPKHVRSSMTKEMDTMDEHRDKLGEAELNSFGYHMLCKGETKGLEKGKRVGRIEGLIEQILLACELRKLRLDAQTEARIASPPNTPWIGIRVA